MFTKASRHETQLKAFTSLLTELADQLDSRISVRLWDGTTVPLGKDVETGYELSISGPGVIGSLLRRPTPENLLRQYAQGHIDIQGADFYTLLETMMVGESRKRLKRVKKSRWVKALLPFLVEPSINADVDHEFTGNITGKDREQKENKDFIQFHYDVSNEFYQLFLDPEMVYSCAYFTDWNNSLEQAQFDKLDMICRKLRLQPGERFLDIGSGWGALLCHAAKHYGVTAHGITLSQKQLELTRQRIQNRGLASQVTVELLDYADLEGEYDKIASVGMYEHIGIANIEGMMKKVRSLLRPRGSFLLHGITRPGKVDPRKFNKMKPERRLLAKHIFPGGELDHLGHTIQMLEGSGFEVHDVEGWRDHYALTCKHWCQRLSANREKAIEFVGEEKYRMWLLYLAGCSFAFRHGGARLYQTLSSKHKKQTPSELPPTRADLYRAA